MNVFAVNSYGGGLWVGVASKICVLSVLVVVSIVSAWLSAIHAGARLAHEPLDVEMRNFDFGTVGQGEDLANTFRLKNTSDSEIHVINVQPSCTCTVPEWNQMDVKANNSVPLQLKFNTREYRGRVYTECAVFYLVGSDTTVRGLNLKLIATVEPDIEMTPDFIEFGPDELTKTVKLSRGRLKNFEIKQAVCTHQAFAAIAKPNSEDGTVTVEVSLDADKWRGYSKQVELQLTTSSSHQPILHIPLAGPNPN